MSSGLEFPEGGDRPLTTLEAFDAMRAFLEAFWRRGGAEPQDLALLLGFLDRGTALDGGPMDPAQWSDWLDAIDAAKSGSSD